MSERNIDSTELVALTEQTFDPAVMFDPMKVETMLALIEEKAVEFEADIDTKKGQDKFRSQAFTVAKIRTAWIKEGKDQNRAINIEVKERNSQCNKIDERLSAVQDKVRKPLTDLENAIKIQEAEHSRLMLMLGERKNIPSDLSVDELSSLLGRTKAIEITGDILGDNYSAATVAKELAVNSLQEKLDNKIQAVKDQDELAELREAKAKQEDAATKERKAKEQAARDEQIRKAAEVKAKMEAEEKLVKAEAAKLKAIQDKKDAAASAERERIAAHKKAEAEKVEALAEANQKAKEAAEQAEVDKKEWILREKEKAEQRDRDRLAKEKKEREAAEKKAAAKGNVIKIHKGIVKDIIACTSITEAQANELIKMQVSGKIRNLTINY